MSNNPKAYLIDIKTNVMKGYGVKNNRNDERTMYEHTGIYSFNDRYILAALEIDPYDPRPSLVGNIANIEYVCSIECHEPLRVCFHAITQSDIVKSKLNSFATQLEAFEDAIQTTIKYLQHQDSTNPKNLENGDSLSNLSEEKIKKMKETIQIAEVPCSSYFYNNELKSYCFKKHYFSV